MSAAEFGRMSLVDSQGTFRYVLFHLPSAGFIALLFGLLCIGVSMHYRRLDARRPEVLSAVAAIVLLILGYKVYRLQLLWNSFVDAGSAGKPPGLSAGLAVYTTFAIVVLIALMMSLSNVLPTRHIRVMGGAILTAVACAMNELWISNGHLLWVFLQALCELPILAVAVLSVFNTPPMKSLVKSPDNATSKKSSANR
jgi:hypothetical protein